MSEKSLSHLLVIAGNGTYPHALVAGARQAGVERITMLAFCGCTSRSVAAMADLCRWFGVGEIEAMFKWIETLGVSYAIMAGGIAPIALFRTSFDAMSRQWLRELKVKNAHTIFGKIAVEIEKLGIKVLPASCYMEAHIPGAGILSAREPDAREASDIAFGHSVARGIGEFDIGQTLLVKEGMVLAVEAFEGTDKAILRGARLGGRGAVIVKAARAGHDMRFDIPVIGRRTIPILRRSKVSALAFQAGRLVMLERAEVVAAANRLGIVIQALPSDLPPAPVRPEGGCYAP